MREPPAIKKGKRYAATVPSMLSWYLYYEGRGEEEYEGRGEEEYEGRGEEEYEGRREEEKGERRRKEGESYLITSNYISMCTLKNSLKPTRLAMGP